MNETTTREAAARARRGETARRDARPAQRRCMPEGGAASRMWTPAQACRVEFRDAAGDAATAGRAVFEGFASVTGRGYEMWDMFGPYTEYVHVGAFAETLAASPDVPLVIDHTSSRRIARTGNDSSPLLLSEVTDGETTGLRTVAPTLDLADPDTAYIAPKLRSRLIDEMSFRFQITSGRWNDEFDEFHIHAVDINRGDVSIVGYGANPHTAGAGLRGKPAGLSATDRALLQLSAAADNYRTTPR